MLIQFTRGTGSLFEPELWEVVECDHLALCEELDELNERDSSWWTGGLFDDGKKRSKAGWDKTTHLALLDFDHPEKRADHAKLLEALRTIREACVPWVLYAHTSPNGLRVAGLIASPVCELEVYQSTVEAMAKVLGPTAGRAGLQLDPKSLLPWQAMFAPRAEVNGVVRVPQEWLNDDPVPFAPQPATTRHNPPQPATTRLVLGGPQGASGSAKEAREQWLSDHRPKAVTRAECPFCGHRECFQVDAEGRWFCHSTNHATDAPPGFGQTEPTGEGWGDALDLASYQQGKTPSQILRDDGYTRTSAEAVPPPDDGFPWILLPGEWYPDDQIIRQSRDDFSAEILGAVPANTLFRRGHVLTRVDLDGRDVVAVGYAGLSTLIDRHCRPFRWVKPAKDMDYERVYGPPPIELLKLITKAMPNHPDVRSIELVVDHPVLARAPDHSIRICPEGYDPESRVFTLPHGLQIDTAMPRATRREVLEDLFVDYPFEDVASFHNVVSLMITMVARPALDIVPLFFTGATLQGSGKTRLLNETVSEIVSGGPAPLTLPKNSEEETRKFLDTMVLAAREFVIIDNMPAGRTVNSASLAAIVTSSRVEMRILGQTKQSTVRNHLTIALTGNNTRFSGELARRLCPIFLNPKTNKPELRDDFVHPDAKAYAQSRRAAVLSAIFSAIQEWQEDGCLEPTVMPRIGSYEQWRAVVGGILEHGLGFNHAMSNQQEFAASKGDGVRDDHERLVQVIRGRYGAGSTTGRTPAELYQLCASEGLFEDAMIDCRIEDPQRRAVYFRKKVLETLENVPTEDGFGLACHGRRWHLKRVIHEHERRHDPSGAEGPSEPEFGR